MLQLANFFYKEPDRKCFKLCKHKLSVETTQCCLRAAVDQRSMSEYGYVPVKLFYGDWNLNLICHKSIKTSFDFFSAIEEIGKLSFIHEPYKHRQWPRHGLQGSSWSTLPWKQIRLLKVVRLPAKCAETGLIGKRRKVVRSLIFKDPFVAQCQACRVFSLLCDHLLPNSAFQLEHGVKHLIQ